MTLPTLSSDERRSLTRSIPDSPGDTLYYSKFPPPLAAHASQPRRRLRGSPPSDTRTPSRVQAAAQSKSAHAVAGTQCLPRKHDFLHMASVRDGKRCGFGRGATSSSGEEPRRRGGSESALDLHTEETRRADPAGCQAQYPPGSKDVLRDEQFTTYSAGMTK